MFRRLALLAVLAIAAAVGPVVTVSAASAAFPEQIPLPPGFQPEGIDIRGTTFYVGSISTGAVFAGDLRTGDGDVVVPPHNGRSAIGVEEAGGLLWVAGGPTGAGYVYDARTGVDVAAFQFTTSTATFVNDVTVTRDAAFFTDSSQPVLYRVDTGTGAVTTLPLTGDYVHVPNAFNLNGIEATPDGRTLLAVQTVNGRLYAIDAATGVATLVDLGGATLVNGDGILLQGHTVYVVQNVNNTIAVVRLAGDFLSGQVVDHLTSATFDIPTTVARFGNRLYVVNARFGTAGDPTTAAYSVSAVSR